MVCFTIIFMVAHLYRKGSLSPLILKLGAHSSTRIFACSAPAVLVAASFNCAAPAVFVAASFNCAAPAVLVAASLSQPGGGPRGGGGCKRGGGLSGGGGMGGGGCKPGGGPIGWGGRAATMLPMSELEALPKRAMPMPESGAPFRFDFGDGGGGLVFICEGMINGPNCGEG